MYEYTEKIRETAKRLLKDGKVDVFIGYKKGSVPMMNEPLLISDPEKTDLLFWDSNCGIGMCGRCNIGDKYVCKDGPVFSLAQLKSLPPEY